MYSKDSFVEATNPKNNFLGNTNNLLTNSDLKHSIYPLFRVRNFTYVELRDCCLTSKNKNYVLDVAFVMNESELQASTPKHAASLGPYKGILSVKSCSIKNFSLAFFAGTNSILSVELS